MNSFQQHVWAVGPGDGRECGELAPSPNPYLTVRCHRRLRGPFTGGGSLLRSVVPELLPENADIVARRVIEITALAPELIPLLPQPPQTLTNLAVPDERTRYYPATQALSLAHGVAELLMDWARARHSSGVVIAFRELDAADPTDRDLVSVLLRRCDPRLLTIVAEADDTATDALGQALVSYTGRGRPLVQRLQPSPPGTDLSQLFIDSDGTENTPAIVQAYASLHPDERARRHSARAEFLAACGEPTFRYGAIPYHLECGSDPGGAGVDALAAAVEETFDLGFYHGALELALRGREIVSRTDRPRRYLNFVHKIGACLTYLDRGEEAMGYFAELRRESTSHKVHMSCSYMMAMLYTRHLPKEAHDEDQALTWVNAAIAIADLFPDEKERVFFGAFMRNARALVELHRNNREGALSLVNEAIRMTDTGLGTDEHLLHRSVLRYNRAQVLSALGEHAAALRDYDEVIRRDPDYGDYYFERAGERRKAAYYAEALADYATAIQLNPPFHEVHFNRADLLRELGDEDGALQDLDYALELQPDHVDSLVNHADLLLARGDIERARKDIELGLALDSRNPHLLSARGSLLEDTDADAAYECYSAAIDEDPAFVAAWANRAVLAYSASRFADAIDDLSHAIQLSDDPALLANRAVAFQELGDHRRALADLDVAIAVLEDAGDLDPDLLYRRGVSRYALNDAEGARADWLVHLAAYDEEPSPFVAEIQLHAADLIARAEVAGSTA